MQRYAPENHDYSDELESARQGDDERPADDADGGLSWPIPDLVMRSHQTNVVEYGIRLCGFHWYRRIVDTGCIRSLTVKTGTNFELVSGGGGGDGGSAHQNNTTTTDVAAVQDSVAQQQHETKRTETFSLGASCMSVYYHRGREEPYAALPTTVYIVVGIFSRNSSVPKEHIAYMAHARDVRAALVGAEKRLRGWRSLLSLKRVVRFGIYECHPRKSYHSRPPLEDATAAALAQLFRDSRAGAYRASRWALWIHERLNGGGAEPAHGAYSLELVLGWSAPRIMGVALAPILLSAVVGLWYNVRTGDASTAWTVASFVLAAAGILIGGVAAVTQIGGV